jgi:WD40 repeat protein
MPLPPFETIYAAIKRKRLPALLASLDKEAGAAAALEARRLCECLQSASGTLSADPTQLAGQLLGRLEERDGPDITSLLAEARTWAGAPWLRPLTNGQFTAFEPTTLRKAILTANWVASVESAAPTVLRLGALDEPPTFLAEHPAPITALACSADERWLAAGDDSGVITLWDVRQRTLAARFKDEYNNENEDVAVWPVDKLFLSQDGALMVSLYDAPGIGLWSVNQPDDPADLCLDGDYATAAAFDGTGRVLATLVDSCQVEVWDLTTHDPITNKTFYDDSFYVMALTSNGQRIVAGSDYGHLIIWEWRTKRLSRIRNKHADDIDALAIAPDGAWAVSIGGSGSIVFWDLIRRKLLARLTLDSPLLSVAIAGAGREALTVDVFGRIHRLRLEAEPPPGPGA